MRALSLQVMVDDIEAEEEGIADMFLDTDTIAVSARPGTSLRTSNTSAALGSTAHRLVDREWWLKKKKHSTGIV